MHHIIPPQTLTNSLVRIVPSPHMVGCSTILFEGEQPGQLTHGHISSIAMFRRSTEEDPKSRLYLANKLPHANSMYTA